MIRALVLAACACRGSSAPERVPITAQAGSADASTLHVPDPSPDPAISDQLQVLTVSRGKPRTAPLPEGKHAPHLAVVAERELEGPPTSVAEVRPPWLPKEFREEPLRVHVELDGTAVAIARHTLVLLDRRHQPEVGLDFTEFRGDLIQRVTLGGDHTFLDNGTVVHEGRRIDKLVIAAGSDAGRDDKDFLVAIDAADGRAYWKTSHGVAPEGFEIVDGHAISSTRSELLVVELDTGRIVQRVRIAHGPYRLALDAKGVLRGRRLASEIATSDGRSFELELTTR